MAKRVLVARIMHETNTFSRTKTDITKFQATDFHLGNSIPGAYRGTRSAMGASFEAAEKYGWMLIHPISAHATPSGLVTTDAFEELTDHVLKAAALGPIDGALLHLHGAMVTEAHEDGEGELLRRLRETLGPDVPVIVTLDLHANVTETMVDSTSALIAFRTYPHVDMYERAWQGADLLQRAMAGEVKLKTVLARRPLLSGIDHGRTQGAPADSPMLELLARADGVEQAGDALVVSLCAGFTRSDIRDVGPTTTITFDEKTAEAAKAQQIAESFMDRVWETRHYSSAHMLTIDEAVTKAQEGKPGDKPLVIADYTDNPGGGAYGDSTALLAAMVAAGLKNVAVYAIYDPEAVQDGIKAGIGATATITLGGKTDASLGGGPLTLTGEVRTLGCGKFIGWGPMNGGIELDFGLSMVFRVGGIDIILISKNGQAKDLGQLTSLGLDPTRYTTITVKSMQHFKAAFAPIAREVVLVDTGSLCSENFTASTYRHVRRPLWPLDADALPS